jgi:hypothetical protein
MSNDKASHTTCDDPDCCSPEEFPEKGELSKDEYQSGMDFLGDRIKEQRESLVIEIANDILEKLNTSPECQMKSWLRNIHIGNAYVTMEAVCCMLYRRNICASYTIKVGKKTEGTKDEERAGQSLCHYTLDLSIYAFKDKY